MINYIKNLVRHGVLKIEVVNNKWKITSQVSLPNNLKSTSFEVYHRNLLKALELASKMSEDEKSALWEKVWEEVNEKKDFQYGTVTGYTKYPSRWYK